MKKLIAIVTKAGLTDIKERNAIVDAIKADDAFDVYEIGTNEEYKDNTSLAVVFGGDGTMLEAVRMAQKSNIALFGVNLGNLGFLTSCEKDEPIEDILAAIKNRKCVEKMLLETSVNGITCSALNEVVVRSATSRPIYVDMSIDGTFVDSYHSDGAIVSSPTGSTAYSLSAGGPVLAPDVDALVINPICPHSLHSRPLVINSDSEVTLSLHGNEIASVFADGRLIANIESGDVVKIVKSAEKANFIIDKEDDFYKKLLQKMNRWGVTSR